jgi:transcription initiation factor TFIIIB Brf1 subunit/transcription initiation factor TFIIB
MNESSPPFEECPACSADNLSYWEELETWICDGCSYVVETGVSNSSTPDFSEDINEDEINDRAWDQSIPVKDKSESNLVDVLSQVEEVADELVLSQELVIRAAEIAVEAWKANFMHGRTKPDTVGAAVYAASREMQQGIPPAIIANKIESDQQSVKDTYQQLKAELNLDIDPPNSTEYLSHVCQELDLTAEIPMTAEAILDGYHAGGNPVGIAAAAVYVVSNNEGTELTLREAAEATGLAKETIWRQVSKIRKANTECETS